MDDVKRSVNVGRPYLEPFEDVRPVVELRCEVGTVSGLVKRNWIEICHLVLGEQGFESEICHLDSIEVEVV